jgi:Nuclease-related domain
VIARARSLSYARRQQYRRLARTGRAVLASALAATVGATAMVAGVASLGAVLLVVAIGFGLRTRYLLSLARRSRIGARSEDDVRRVLEPLEAEGWRLRHSLLWQGPGDVDSVAIAPSGIGIVIETKTRADDRNHLARVREQEAWLLRRRRRWCRAGALAVLCVAGVRGVERVEDEVLVVSLDRLVSVLRAAATMGNQRAVGGAGELAGSAS